MLRLLSGRTHHVTTGFVLHGADAFDAPAYAETTAVTFRALAEDEVRRYAATGEGVDKAGGYAIQGLAGAFVERIEGSYANVVGLPVHRVVEVLLRTRTPSRAIRCEPRRGRARGPRRVRARIVARRPRVRA
jgi:septum formation protein